MTRLRLLLALLFLYTSGNAATVSGTATFLPGWNYHQSAWGAKVYLADSSAATNSIVYLDSSSVSTTGAYAFTLPSSITSGYIRTYVSLPGCTNRYSSYYLYSGGNLSIPNITLNCSGPFITDTFRNAATGAPVYGKLVYLVDSTATHYFRDSAYTQATGEARFGVPPAIRTGSLRIFTNSCGVQSQTLSFGGSSLIAPTMLICDSNVTVSGTITDLTTSRGIPYQSLVLQDSAGSAQLYQAYGTTDASGNYSFRIPLNVTSGTMTLLAAGCGQVYSASGSFTGTNLILNITACAAIAAGTIYTTNGIRGAAPVPAAGATVMIYKDLCAPCANVVTKTDSRGRYVVGIPAGWALPCLITILDSAAAGSPACHGMNNGPQILYTGGSVVLNDTMCNYPWYTIGGKVTYQGGGGVANAKVWLISDTSYTAGNTILTALDSTTTNSSGDYYFTQATGWYHVGQHVKAALPAGHPDYANYLPTYGDSSLLWSTANKFYAPAWLGYNMNLNISLRGGPNPGGAGFIAGRVVLGANKTSTVGDPLQSRILMLTTAAGKAVGYAYSDAAGKFSFSNIPNGSYLLFGDAWGKANPALAVRVSAAAPASANIIFEENSTQFRGHFDALGVSSPTGLAALRISPNPASSTVSIPGLSAIDGDKLLKLRDIRGQVLSELRVGAGSNAGVPVAALPAGMYQLQVQTQQGTVNLRFIRQ